MKAFNHLSATPNTGQTLPELDQFHRSNGFFVNFGQYSEAAV